MCFLTSVKLAKFGELSDAIVIITSTDRKTFQNMDKTDDGGVTKGDKELDSTYTIPKKTVAEDDSEEAKLAETGHGSILANAYANFMPASHAYQTGANIAAWANQQTSAYFSNYCQYVMNASQKGALKRGCVDPKTAKPNITCDASLPKELTALFQPLYCKLCSVQLSSNIMAKMHYKSKNHEKKMRKFLIEHSEKTGEPLHKRAKAQSDLEEYDPRHFHCDVCDLPLTGKAHAESHYMGKNHQKVIMGKKPPTGKGYYNDEGKWVRTIQTKTGIPGGHDGFGMDFLPVKPEVKPETTLYCDLCNVSVTSMPQMEMHLQGQKHSKKLKQQQLSGGGEQLSTEQNGEASVMKTNQNDLLSSYRTPSGQYYCKMCNISLNSETQFVQHLNSRKHLKKSNSKE